MFLNVVKFKWVYIVLTITLTIFFAFQLPKLSINSDILKSLPDDDKHAKMLKDISENFGGHNIGLIILEAENVYTTEVIQSISQISDSLLTIEGIGSVSSLTNIINIKADDEGIEVGKLVDPYNIPTSEDDFQRLKENINANNLYKDVIVSEDETSALIMFYLTDDADVKKVALDVIETTNTLDLDETLYFAGSPMLVSYISDLMRNDLTTLLPIALFVIALVLFLSFKSWTGVILPLLSSIIAIIWTLGCVVLLGFKMTMISNNIPIIILAVGSAYSIHVINKIRSETSNNRFEAGLNAVKTPVILASITTAIGFISFIFGAYLEMIVEFGIFSSLGTFFACILALTFVPSAMAVTSNDQKTKGGLEHKQSILDGLISRLNGFIFSKPKVVFAIWAILITTAGIGIFNIERSVNIQDYFKPNNPARKAEQIMMEKFGGTKPVFVKFSGDILNPTVLKQLRSCQEYMEESPDINSTLSVADLVAELNYTITGERAVPEDEEQIQQLWFLLDGNEALERLINEDLTEAIIISKFKSPDNTSKQVFADYMNDFIAENESPDYSISITGMPFVDIVMDRSLIKSQIGSIIIALVFIIILLGFILKSVKQGLLATVPIICTMIILFGFMGITGITLNIATVLVASVALGIGIDYSIHIIMQFNKLIKTESDSTAALSQSISSSGKAIIINFLSVSCGFLVLVFSEMVPLVYFGILIAISMFSSGIGALTLLPVLLKLTTRK